MPEGCRAGRRATRGKSKALFWEAKGLVEVKACRVQVGEVFGSLREGLESSEERLRRAKGTPVTGGKASAS